MTGKNILLNPGPVTISDRVRRALLKQDLCHREPEFANMSLDVKRRLTEVYPAAATEYDAILITGSGTSAVEAMLSTFVPNNGKALVVTNGVYGERMAKMLTMHQKKMDIVHSDWHEAVNFSEVERCLKESKKFTHVVAVHHETTTGRLNDMDRLGKICKQKEIPLLLDGVSSFGVEAIEFDSWNVEACASTANKCLHGVPGLSFVMARHSAFDSRSSASGSLYLDLFSYYKDQRNGYSPFTQAVHVTYALQEALIEMDETGGRIARYVRYQTLANKIREGLYRNGIKSFLNDSDFSVALSSFVLLSGLAYGELHEYLKRQGFVIYAGQGGLSEKIFRIANMGNIQPNDIDKLIDCFKELKNRSV